MKAREYEFEGKRYRWRLADDSIIYHQQNKTLARGWWYPTNIPPTPAAASALAALIEDMQVQVIAEWEDVGTRFRARETPEGINVEFWDHDGWLYAATVTRNFRAGYEAGKAAQTKPEAVTNTIQVWVNGDKQDTAAEVARRIAEQLKHPKDFGGTP